MPLEPILTVTDASDANVTEVIDAGLYRFNVAQSGIEDWRALNVVVSDPETGQVLGGMTGRTSLGLLFIDLFFLPEHLRGGGLGSRILELAEEEARRRGCVAASVITISFQAPAFYTRRGYRIFGQIECTPPGTSRVFLSKTLG